MTDKSCTRNDNLAWVAGSDAPEKRTVNLGFMALSDSASLIVAATQGFAQQYGLTLHLKRQTSWAALRDNLLNGELDAAHSLYGQVYGIHLGLGGAPTKMAILMGLCQNGQAINFSEQLRQAGVTRAQKLAAQVHQRRDRLTFAQTFPTGTHAMWLYYWLAAQGIHPLEDVNTVVLPPAQMLQHLRAGRIDGFCAGDPWGALAVDEKQGFTLATSQMIWPDHPEKVLACARAFVEEYPNTSRALTMAVLEASRFIDASDENKRSTAQLICGSEYLDAPFSAILPRFLGHYEDGLGYAWRDAHPLRFFAGGYATMPWLSDGIWFMTQFRRWGLLRKDPDYLGIARQIHQLAIYRESAEALGIAVPEHPMRSSTLLDGKTWDGSDPTGYAHGFAINGFSRAAAALPL